MTSIFISYSHKDTDFVARLERELAANNIRIWRDEHDITAGDSFIEAISKGIEQSDYMGLVLSPNSIDSPWVKEEYEAALVKQRKTGKKFLIPIYYQKCEVPTFIATKKWADFSKTYSDGFSQLMALLEPTTLPLVPITQTSSNPAWATYREIARNAIEKKTSNIPTMREGFRVGKFLGEEEVGPSENGTMGLMHQYDHAMVIWHDNGKCKTKVFAVYGAIARRYRSMGNERWAKLGFPIADEDDVTPSQYENNLGQKNIGRYAAFESGEIVWYSNGEYRDQAFAIWDPIRKAYDALGGSGSYLGFPVSEPQQINGGEMCNFEGGTIVTLNGERGVHIVRQLLNINYSDSPFAHGWRIYTGSGDSESASIRHGRAAGDCKSYVSFNFPWNDRGIRFPSKDLEPDLGNKQFCGLTLKSLTPSGDMTFYMRTRTNAAKPQNIAFGVSYQKGFRDDKDWADYWKSPLPDGSNNGEWHTLIIDLQKYVRDGFTRSFGSISSFHFRAQIGIADLLVSDSLEAIKAIAINPIVL